MIFLCADEAGNFDFSAKGSSYFVVTSVTAADSSSAAHLLDLRHELSFQTTELREDGFHATEDKQHIRDKVFKLIQQLDLKIDVVILDKRKTRPDIAQNEDCFYQLAWNFLLRYVAKSLPIEEDLLIIAGSLGTKQKKQKFKQALHSVARQHVHNSLWALAFWKSSSHPCLQITDYCAWAVQRWKERDDSRSLILIESKISSIYEPFSDSAKLCY